MSDIYDPVVEFDQLDPEDREDYLADLDADEKRRVLRSRADKRAAEDPPAGMGTFGSTTQQIGQQVSDKLRRDAWEPDEWDPEEWAKENPPE